MALILPILMPGAERRIVMTMPRPTPSFIHTIEVPVAGSRHAYAKIQVVYTGEPDTILYTGFGNEGRVVLGRVVRLLEKLGVHDVAVVGALPYWRVPADRQKMLDMAVKAVAMSTEYVTSLTGAQSVHAIAESQAAVALAHGALERPELFNNIALLRPLGLVRLSKKRFAKRMLGALTQADQLLDWRSVPVGNRAALRTMQAALRHGDQLEAALSTDIRRQVAELLVQRNGKSDGHESRHAKVFAAANDKLFTVPELLVGLGGRNGYSTLPTTANMEVIPGSHSSPATRAGAQQIKHVVEWCRE
jgi:hypothetical protein